MTKPINKTAENEIESSEELLQEQEIETTPEELEEVQNNKKPSFWEQARRFICGVEDENAKINIGHVDEKYDREQGYINKLNPYSSLKNNAPLIKLNNNSSRQNNQNKKCVLK
jgi:hypothetical protein